MPHDATVVLDGTCSRSFRVGGGLHCSRERLGRPRVEVLVGSVLCDRRAALRILLSSTATSLVRRVGTASAEDLASEEPSVVTSSQEPPVVATSDDRAYEIVSAPDEVVVEEIIDEPPPPPPGSLPQKSDDEDSTILLSTSDVDNLNEVDAKALKLIMGELRYIFNETPDNSRCHLVQDSCPQSATH